MSRRSYSKLINSSHRAPLRAFQDDQSCALRWALTWSAQPGCCGEAGDSSKSICIVSGTQPLRTCFSDKQGDVSDCRQLLQPCSTAQPTCASTCAHSQSPERAQQVIKFVNESLCGGGVRYALDQESDALSLYLIWCLGGIQKFYAAASSASLASSYRCI